MIGLWFMLRESEMAHVKAIDLQLVGHEVHLTIPLHKTDQRAHQTRRSLPYVRAGSEHMVCVCVRVCVCVFVFVCVYGMQLSAICFASKSITREATVPPSRCSRRWTG